MDVMGGEKHHGSCLACDTFESFKDHLPVVGVKEGCRLIQEYVVGPADQSCRYAGFLELSVTDPGYVFGGYPFESEKFQAALEFRFSRGIEFPCPF